MSIKIEYLDEPKLQFNQYFEYEDAKTGLAEFGPFGINVSGLHCPEIKLGFVGTRETISGAKEWIEECSSAIESENVKKIRLSEKASGGLFGEDVFQDEQHIRLEKILNRDLWDLIETLHSNPASK